METEQTTKELIRNWVAIEWAKFGEKFEPPTFWAAALLIQFFPKELHRTQLLGLR